MGDRLTQLQDCLDDLLMQMFATLNYIQTHHPYGEITGQPNQAPQAESDEKKESNAPIVNGTTHKTTAENGTIIKAEQSPPAVLDTPRPFKSALRELAQDLVVQEQKAEILINSLPGIGNSERDQRLRMLELQKELETVEAERAAAEKTKTEMLANLDRVILSLKRGK